LTWDEAMNKIRESQNKASTSLELFGKRGAVAGLILAENEQMANDLTIAYENAAGAANEMAEIKLDNVAGAMTKLSSAWEGLVLRTNQSNGALKEFLLTLTDIVTAINTKGKPAIDSMFESQQIESFGDKFRFYRDQGVGFWNALTNAAFRSKSQTQEFSDGLNEVFESEKHLLETTEYIAVKIPDAIAAIVAAPTAGAEAITELLNKINQDALDVESEFFNEMMELEMDFYDEGKKLEEEAFWASYRLREKEEEDKKRKREEELKAEKDLRMAIASSALSTATNLAGSLVQIVENQKQRELSAAGDNAAERERIEKEYAEKQRKLSIGQAIVSGAEAIIRQFADLPFPAALITSSLVAAQTAAQIAVINSQKFAKGGYEVLGGHVHSEGGTMTPIGEAEKGEGMAIFTRQATAGYADVIPEIVESVNNGKFFDVFGRTATQLINVSVAHDPYTKRMYELMRNIPHSYLDSNNDLVKEYPNGTREIIRHG